MNKQLYLYINALSDLGSRMNLIAVTALLFSYENSAYWLMAYFIARQMGALFSSLYAGVLADRLDRRTCMIASDLICGMAIAAVVLFPQPLTAVISASIIGVLYNLFQISFDASLSSLFSEKSVYETNGRIVRLGMLVNLLGFSIGGVLADQLGARFLIAFDAATFFVSAYCLSRMRWARKPQGETVEVAGWREDMGIAAAYLRGNPFYAYLILLSLLYALGGTAWNYGLPLLSQLQPDHQSTMHGFMWTTMGAGGLAGSYLIAKVRLKLIPALLGSMGLFTLFITLAFAGTQPTAILAFLFLAGFIDAVTQMAQRTLLQTSDNLVRGRVLGIQAFFIRFGYLSGFLLEPFLVSWFSLFGMVLFVQGLVVAAVAIISLPLLNSARQTLPK